ncbi:MAG: tetratricopeptide repeat protein [Hyphomicrobiaceae bacterium]
MPFKDLSANGEFGHLAEGIRIDLQYALVKILGLFVIAVGSAAIYANRSIRPDQVSNEMGVQYVLEATIRGNGKKIRLTVQLTNGTTGQVIWSEHYDRRLDRNFLVQDEIVEEIVTSLNVTLVSGEQARVWCKTLRDPKALELCYRGLETLSTFDKPSVAEARQLFERVTEISPNVTLGPTLVAFCHYWDAIMGWSENAEDALEEAGRWAEGAAKMEDADGQAHAILAHVKLLRGEHTQALEIAQEAIKLRPLCATTNALSANVLLYYGRPKDAAERVRSAIRYSPVYAAWWVEILASAYRDAGENNSAIAAANELLRKNPDSLGALLLLATALVANDDLVTARGHVAKILRLDPQFSLSRYASQHPYQNKEQLSELLSNLRQVGLPE